MLTVDKTYIICLLVTPLARVLSLPIDVMRPVGKRPRRA